MTVTWRFWRAIFMNAEHKKQLLPRSANNVKGRLSRFVCWMNSLVCADHTMLENASDEYVLTEQNFFDELRNGLFLCSVVQKLNPCNLLFF